MAEYVFITAVVAFFLYWFSLEFMERFLGLTPAIRRASSIDKEMRELQTKDTSVDKNDIKKINEEYAIKMRLTKSLDTDGRFRVQSRGTINLIYAAWMIGLCVTCFIMLSYDPYWFYRHFWLYDETTIEWEPYPNVTMSLLTFYVWNLATERYTNTHTHTVFVFGLFCMYVVCLVC